LAHALELQELHQVVLEKLTGYPRKFYTQTITQPWRIDYQDKARAVYISLPYKVMNSILLKQVELFEEKLTRKEREFKDIEQQLKRIKRQRNVDDHKKCVIM